ncbi:MAG: nucleotide sugar dehydrogenase [Patescibacteria group bacterium]
MKNLETLIKNKKAKITIIGLGYVGLPLAVVLAEQGFRVFGFDVQKNKVKLVNQGHSYIADISSADLQGVLKSKKFSATTDKKILKLADVIIICVPTPLDKYKQPDITYIQSTVKEIARFIRKGQLIILESTTYPGTTREVILPVLQKSGLKVGKDFFLAFSPERIDPGNQKFNVRNVPKVVGGITPKCTKLTNLVYRSFLDKVFKVSSPEAAEMTKILENTFRIVNVSMINELALLCGKMGIDIWEVIEAAKTKPYGFMPFYPGPGIGGHCIPLDPFYLSWKAKEYGFYTRFIELGGEINDQMPHFVVTKVISGLNQHKKSLNGAKILVWGVAYKKDVADPRESASYHVIRDLWKKGANVEYFDPYIPEFKIDNKNLKSIEYQPKNLKHYDCVLILADHSNLNYDEVAKKSLLVVDTRNAIKNRKFKNVLWL